MSRIARRQTHCERRAAADDETSTALPPQMHVFVRDWLSANHIVLRSRDGGVVIDSGYGKHAPLTLALVASRMGLDGEPLAKLVNTHCHSDHMGGNAALHRAYGCPIAVPAGEAPLVDAWDERALLLDYADQRAERFAVDEVLRPGSTHVWGDLEWRLLAAPGHDMGALVFFNDEHRDPDLRRRAVGERLRIRDAAGPRSRARCPRRARRSR